VDDPGGGGPLSTPVRNQRNAWPLFVSAQASPYPLRQEHLGPSIQAFAEVLTASGLEPRPGPMSTLVSGEADVLFAALRDPFVRAAAGGHVVMTVTISNACPV
jgi:uncharacterized protein YqgV (UPF0045/DUF77 family)